MAYTVLARKYRSQTFDDVVGQDPIAQTLKNAIKTDRVSHAYLFSGTRGVGKTTMARILAKALNCLAVDKPTTKPCCKCDSCTAINIGEDIDVIEIDGASNNRVDEIRELRENAIYRPARSRFKIYIIDEVHMLTTSAFNALLKTLEEPPSHIKFIFATTKPNKVIATIQSRCQRFDFSNIGPASIAGQLKSILKKEKIKYEEDLLLPLAKMANGSMRDGLSLLDRMISTGVEPLNSRILEEFLGCPNSEKIWNLIGQIGDSDPAGTLAAIEDLISTGISEAQVVDSLIDYMRDLMVVKSTGTDSKLVILTDQQRKRAGELAEKFDVAALVYNISTLEKLRWTIKSSDTSRALLEASMLRFALSEHFLNVDELLSQLRLGASPGIKKNLPPSGNIPIKAVARPNKPQTIKYQSTNDESEASSELTGINSIKDNWQNLLGVITTKLGPGTSGLLSSAVPARFENGILTLEFGASAKMQKQMCESNGRAEQIQSLLSEQLSTPLRLKFEIATEQQTQAVPSASRPKTTGQRRNEIINNPAVKTILMGLDATITAVEED
ncbi:MAG: DNA polymerase III subunit gamma/tau [Planctomycetes bacterium]|nr:DNA polymerase III subunit gamma/tau [Planctomycetota bacterium]MBL7142973.1 DNA polymerase III subunit gamma/tau [Phycisphaerae bacterium]